MLMPLCNMLKIVPPFKAHGTACVGRAVGTTDEPLGADWFDLLHYLPIARNDAVRTSFSQKEPGNWVLTRVEQRCRSEKSQWKRMKFMMLACTVKAGG